MTETREALALQRMEIHDPTELATVAALRSRLAHVPVAIQRWSRVTGIEPKNGSEIARDDAACKGRQISHALTHQLHHAADTLQALTVLIPPTGPLTIPYVAHYPVARSALEAASLALWILSAEDPKTRIERHLRNSWRELSAEADMKNAALRAATDPAMGMTALLDQSRKQTKAWKSKHVAQIRKCANGIGVADPTLSSRTVGFAEIVREATAASGLHGIYGEIVWRETSGLSHPSMLKALSSQDVVEVSDYGDGTFGALISSNVGKVKYSVEAALSAFIAAVDLFGRRKIQAGDGAAYLASPTS